MLKRTFLVLALGVIFSCEAFSQKDSTQSFSLKGKVKPFGMVQMWSRYLDYNPGSQVSGQSITSGNDFSIRRYRIGVTASITPQWFFMIVMGENNLNVVSDRGVFSLLDFLVEYRWKKYLQFGAGKSSWRGVSRYASPNTSKMLGQDISGVALATINKNDHILRRVGVYAKGQVSHLDYRVAVSSPFLSETQGNINADYSAISNKPGELNYSSYVKWNFLGAESNSSAYTLGTYLGEKKVLAVGVGAEFQRDAYFYLQGVDTVYSNMFLSGLDLFYEAPIHEGKGDAITVYAAGLFYDYGKDYIRNVGLNNPASTVDANGTFAGRGNAYPMLGTGRTAVLQLGYLFPYFKNREVGRIQLFSQLQFSDYDRLGDNVILYEGGLNWFMKGHLSKFSIAYQNRPIFEAFANEIFESDRKGQLVVQYQFRFE